MMYNSGGECNVKKSCLITAVQLFSGETASVVLKVSRKMNMCMKVAQLEAKPLRFRSNQKNESTTFQERKKNLSNTKYKARFWRRE